MSLKDEARYVDYDDFAYYKHGDFARYQHATESIVNKQDIGNGYYNDYEYGFTPYNYYKNDFLFEVLVLVFGFGIMVFIGICCLCVLLAGILLGYAKNNFKKVVNKARYNQVLSDENEDTEVV